MENIPNCPECGSEYTYEDGELYVCPECAHEWSKNRAEEEGEAALVKERKRAGNPTLKLPPFAVVPLFNACSVYFKSPRRE